MATRSLARIVFVAFGLTLIAASATCVVVGGRGIRDVSISNWTGHPVTGFVIVCDRIQDVGVLEPYSTWSIRADGCVDESLVEARLQTAGGWLCRHFGYPTGLERGCPIEADTLMLWKDGATVIKAPKPFCEAWTSHNFVYSANCQPDP